MRRNPALWTLAALVIAVLAIAIYWGPAQRLFQFGPLHIDDLAVCLLAGAVLIALLEASKFPGLQARLFNQ
jgi:Ca2+-transporting ATPase